MAGDVAPRFSVIMPLYNKGAHIERAIRSAQIAGEALDIEIVVLDDGSTDDGPAIVRRMAADDPRIQLFAQANGGEGAARNAAVSRARGEILAFLDCDDAWLPDHLKEIDRLVRSHPQAGCFATAYEIQHPDGTVSQPAYGHLGVGQEGGVLPSYFRACAMGGGPLLPSCTAVRRTLYETVGGMREELVIAADRVLWFSIARHAAVAWSPLVGARYHRDAENRLMRRWTWERGRIVLGLLDSYLAEPGLDPALRASIQAARFAEDRIQFNVCCEFGLKGAAARYLLAYARGRGPMAALPLLPKLVLPLAVYSRIRTAIRAMR